MLNIIYLFPDLFSSQLRDLRMIGHKLKYVLLPKVREEGTRELRNCNREKKNTNFNVSRRTCIIPNYYICEKKNY